LGIEGELGRGEDLLKLEGTMQRKKKYDGKCFGTEGNISEAPGTSIFDPVLCELMYKWFCPEGGLILDPFAGESTKGIVAEILGFKYTGIELRDEQIAANEAQAEAMGLKPSWLQGNSEYLDLFLPQGQKYDLVFTSPPYYDLEVYSDAAADGSAKQTYAEFMEWYRGIFKQAVARLRPNRFLVVKVSEIRDKKTGIYRNFVGDNITCFNDMGLRYYNEIILVNAVGSLPIRVSRQFEAGRKVGRTHQNILVFFKGDPGRIKKDFGDGTFKISE